MLRSLVAASLSWRLLVIALALAVAGLGTWAFERALPGTDWGTAQDHALPFPSDWRLLNEGVRHGFTHFELELKVASTALADRRQLPPGIDPVWAGRADVAAAGLPTLFARAAALALAHLPLLEGA